MPSTGYAGRVIARDCAGPLPQVRWTLEAHPATIHALTVSPDGNRFATADRQPQKPRLLVHDLASGRELLAIEVAELSGYRRVEEIEWGESGR